MTRENYSSRPWPPAEYKEAIGQICVNSAQLEASVRTVIWQVAGVGSITGRAFTGKARISDLLETLKTLVEVNAPHLLHETTPICSKIATLFAKRAEFVHNVWTVGDDLKPAIGKLFLERHEKKETLRTVAIEEMHELAELFIAVEGELFTRVLSPLVPTEPK